jgi:hypothetical protein
MAGPSFPLAVGGKHIAEPDQRLPAIEIEPDQNARNRIGEVVMPTRTVVDRVAARARRPPLQPTELGRQARQVEQFDATRVQKRQQVVIQIALRSGGLLEFNPVLSEPSTRPLAGVTIANDLRDAITA